MWLPSLADRSGPKYLRIADALAEDVYSGRLAAGDMDPAVRKMQFDAADDDPVDEAAHQFLPEGEGIGD